MSAREDVATEGFTSCSPAELLRRLRLAPAEEENRGHIEANLVASRVVASIPEQISEIVQTACAIEAIEKEDYASWPAKWRISIFRTYLLTNLTLWRSENDLMKFQRTRYQELHDLPHLLQRITHGFTRRILARDKKGFIDELMSAGRRQSSRGDEASAIDEKNVVHIALSYKHATTFDKGGTIDNETAEEAYEIICKMISYTHLRVWIDQNLHRYPADGPWYERGFLPYGAMTVVSALGEHGGFALGLRRPWIWVETGLALNALGIHCRQDICSTIEEVIVYPQNSLVNKVTFENMGTITGTGSSVFDSVSQILRSVSWWTPDMLSHKDYEYGKEFKEFAQWAKAQVARLHEKGTLDLSTDKFEDTILENLCWMKALPADMSTRQLLQSPYLRVELDVRKARKQLALLQVSGKCRNEDGVYELLGKFVGVKTFCFTFSSDKLSLNVNPSQRPTRLRYLDAEGDKDRDADFEALKTSRGGYSLWDRRFPFHEMPRFLFCGTVFGRHFGMRHRLGEEGCDITLGGFSFTRDGFLSVGFRVEGVYVSRSEHGEKYLSESDVLVIRELSEDLQKELVISLSSQEAFPSMVRILKAERDITNALLTPRTIGTTSTDIELGIWKIEGEDVGADEVNIRRIRLDDYLHILSISDNRFGQLVYTFQTTGVLETPLSDLLHFKTKGDINMTLSKIRLMMGSDEFSGYSKDGLSLGKGVYNGQERYPYEFCLEGSEFLLCHKCKAIYSPINLMMCVVSSNLRTRKVNSKWGQVHRCSEGGRPCKIIGTAE